MPAARSATTTSPARGVGPGTSRTATWRSPTILRARTDDLRLTLFSGRRIVAGSATAQERDAPSPARGPSALRRGRLDQRLDALARRPALDPAALAAPAAALERLVQPVDPLLQEALRVLLAGRQLGG